MSSPPTDGDPPENGKPGKLIVLPGGKGSVNTDEIGADFVVAQVGHVPTPEIVDPVAIDHELRERVTFVKRQELVRVAGNGAPTTEMMDCLIREITEELAHLKFERRRASKEGKSTANYTIGRIAGLRNLAEILLKRKEAALGEKLDLNSPRVKKLFDVWLGFFYDSMEKSGIQPEIIDLVFKQMKADMVDWESKMSSE